MNAYIERVRQSERITVNLGGTAGILFLSYDRTGIFYFGVRNVYTFKTMA